MLQDYNTIGVRTISPEENFSHDYCHLKKLLPWIIASEVNYSPVNYLLDDCPLKSRTNRVWDDETDLFMFSFHLSGTGTSNSTIVFKFVQAYWSGVPSA